jgi:hypothetical protein
MPNWCFTSLVVRGDENEVRDLYEKMKSLEDREETLVPNGFGKTWLGNLVTILGGDWNEVRCRGDWSNLALSDYECVLRFDTESAWIYPKELIDFLLEKYPGVDIYFSAEEPSMAIYLTNDVDGLYFADRYVLSQEDSDPEYYSAGEEKEFLRDLSEMIGKEINNIDDVWKEVCGYNFEHEDNCIEVQIYDVIK